DQVDLISSISDNHLKLLADVKDLVKERAALEREYALKLQALARRGQEKRARLMTALLVGDTPTRAWGDDAVKKSTFDRAYDHLLTSFEQQAMDHIDLSEALGSQVVDSFRALERTTQERQSKQGAFYSKLLAEREKHYNEQAKVRLPWRSSQASQTHLSQRSTYIIATAVANTVKQQFYDSDLPRLEDVLINQLAAIVDRAESIHLTHLDALRGRHASVQETLKTVDTAADQALFVEFNRRPFQTPPPWEFEACPDFYDTVR
ncbi:Cdc15 domain-containing protein, partial [Auricularia subglabra TFB-10046 SS5]